MRKTHDIHIKCYNEIVSLHNGSNLPPTPTETQLHANTQPVDDKQIEVIVPQSQEPIAQKQIEVVANNTPIIDDKTTTSWVEIAVNS